jgi:hypothetical protein
MFHSDDLGGADGRLGYAVGVFGGEGRNRLGDSFGWLLAGRAAIRPMGGFDDLVEADLERSESPKLAIGVSGAWNTNTNRSQSTTGDLYEAARFDYVHAGADLMFKWAGFDLSSELLFRRADEDSLVAPESGLREFSRSGWGWYAQAGEMLTKKLQVAARYGHLVPLEGTDPELEEAQELGGGLSYYLQDHALKVQLDWFWLFGEALEGGEQQARLEFQITL